jgi:hypothetical protein
MGDGELDLFGLNNSVIYAVDFRCVSMPDSPVLDNCGELSTRMDDLHIVEKQDFCDGDRSPKTDDRLMTERKARGDPFSFPFDPPAPGR